MTILNEIKQNISNLGEKVSKEAPFLEVSQAKVCKYLGIRADTLSPSYIERYKSFEKYERISSLICGINTTKFIDFFKKK